MKKIVYKKPIVQVIFFECMTDEEKSLYQYVKNL